jgi:hypothetical protein
MAFDFAMRTMDWSLPRIWKGGFPCGLTMKVNRPGVAGSGLNAGLGRARHEPIVKRRVFSYSMKVRKAVDRYFIRFDLGRLEWAPI